LLLQVAEVLVKQVVAQQVVVEVLEDLELIQASLLLLVV
jgi:hypothetical protein